MGVFEDIYVKARTAFGIVSDKAGQLVGISKLRVAIAECESKRRRKFEELGRMVYQAEKKGSSNGVDVDAHVAAVDELNERIESIKLEIDELKEKVVCRTCNGKSDKDSRYCGRCGANLNDDRSPASENKCCSEDDTSESDSDIE
jgi:uncharacterized small protein (DUF1192 family)